MKFKVDSNISSTDSCDCVKYSIGIQNILNVLNNANIEYQMEYSVPGELEGDSYCFDFALFKDNQLVYLIEFDEEQHYKNSIGYMNKYQEEDKKKNKWALSHGIPLVRIPYWERDNINLGMLISSQYLVGNKTVLCKPASSIG